MAITAQSIIQRVATTLQDTSAVRWATNELVRYLNDGQREAVILRPDATITNGTMALVTGAKQTLPAGVSRLVEVIRNTSGRVVRLTTRFILDAQKPNWYTSTASDTILHYMYDPRDPQIFYVYPPAHTAASLEIVYSALPTDVAEPAAGTTYTSVTGNIDLPDTYSNALVDYVLYRALTKDSEVAANAQRAVAHFEAFKAALATELSGATGMAPRK